MLPFFVVRLLFSSLQLCFVAVMQLPSSFLPKPFFSLVLRLFWPLQLLTYFLLQPLTFSFLQQLTFSFLQLQFSFPLEPLTSLLLPQLFFLQLLLYLLLLQPFFLLQLLLYSLLLQACFLLQFFFVRLLCVYIPLQIVQIARTPNFQLQVNLDNIEVLHLEFFAIRQDCFVYTLFVPEMLY